jgi:hypothetical protein
MRAVKLALASAALTIAGSAAAPAAVASCDGPAREAMPDGNGHDHAAARQHAHACGIRALAYRDVRDLVPETIEFGEADVSNGLAAMAVAYPWAGFVLFDVSDPPRPRALSRFRADDCEVVVMDYDCGADVKLSDDGTLAFVALQRSRVPQGEPRGTTVKPDRVGILIVDISRRDALREIGFTPIAPRGTHLLAYRRIRNTEYVFAIHNGVGYSIYRLTRPASLRLVADVRTKGAHDLFPYEDPVDGKTYLYLSGATAGLFVYDISNVAKPALVGEWHPPVERRREAWYVHSAWTFRRGDRRFTLVEPELSEPGQDHAALPSPVWLLDTTDHAHPKLAGRWSNPAGRPAGALGFSAHNFWYENGRTWLAHYHGGVWLLDWNPVLNGSAQSPAVLGFTLPHESTRPFVEVRPRRRFLSAFDTRRRPMVWDVVSDGRYAYVSDITGGFSVVARERPGDDKARRANLAAYAGAGALVIAVVALLVVWRKTRAQ